MERVLLHAQDPRKRGELRLDEEKVGLLKRRKQVSCLVLSRGRGMIKVTLLRASPPPKGGSKFLGPKDKEL